MIWGELLKRYTRIPWSKKKIKIFLRGAKRRRKPPAGEGMPKN